jgi:hypothetical protein
VTTAVIGIYSSTNGMQLELLLVQQKLLLQLKKFAVFAEIYYMEIISK